MKNQNEKEKLQSRRMFFKQAAKKALPIVAVLVLPNILYGCEKDDNGGGGSGSNSCGGTCSATCKSACKGLAVKINSGCGSSCRYACYSSCMHMCMYSAGK